MKYIDADLLRKDIEKRLKNIRDYTTGVGMKYKGPKYYKAQGKESAYDAFLSIIDSLQQEQQEVDLEKEIDRFYGMYRKDGKTFDLTDNEQCMDWKMNCNSDFKIEFARHFYELGKNSK